MVFSEGIELRNNLVNESDQQYTVIKELIRIESKVDGLALDVREIKEVVGNSTISENIKKLTEEIVNFSQLQREVISKMIDRLMLIFGIVVLVLLGIKSLDIFTLLQ